PRLSPSPLSLHDALPILSAERLREEQVSDAVRSITPGPDTTGISALTIPPADLARANFRAERAERRANRAEQGRDRRGNWHVRGDRKSTRLNSSHVSISY